MKRLALLALAAAILAGCKPMNRFEVVVLDPGPTYAQLQLCGRAPTPMFATRKGFELRLPASCQGSGRIVVSFGDQPDVICPIKFVTTKMSAWYRFEEADNACVVK